MKTEAPTAAVLTCGTGEIFLFITAVKVHENTTFITTGAGMTTQIDRD